MSSHCAKALCVSRGYVHTCAREPSSVGQCEGTDFWCTGPRTQNSVSMYQQTSSVLKVNVPAYLEQGERRIVRGSEGTKKALWAGFLKA